MAGNASYRGSRGRSGWYFNLLDIVFVLQALVTGQCFEVEVCSLTGTLGADPPKLATFGAFEFDGPGVLEVLFIGVGHDICAGAWAVQ